MKHIGTQLLETQQLVLRRFTTDDAQAIFDNWASDPAVTEFLCWPTHTSIDVTKKVVEDIWTANYLNDDFYQWAIVLKEIGEPIGSIGVVAHKDEIKMAHIGYCIGKKWWHKGYVSEALAALIAFFFEKVGVNRVEARHDPNNPNSGKVMKKCGLKYEGTMRQADTNNKGIVDACMYGLVADDYKAMTVSTRCGLHCIGCDFKESHNCGGCIETNGNPFHGECPVAKCCQDKGYIHCGECADIPCELLTQYSCDPEHGDKPQGARIEQCKRWVEQK